MRLYHDTYRDRRTGRRKEAARWSIEFRDHDERPRRLAAFSDKKASEELGRKIVRLVDLRAAGSEPDRALAKAIQDWPQRVRERLQKIGVLDARQVSGARPLSALIADFEEHVKAGDRTAKHVAHVVGHVRRLFESCSFDSWTDISATKVELFLRRLREGEAKAVEAYIRSYGKRTEGFRARYREKLGAEGLSAKSSNHILSSAKQFVRWAVERGFGQRDPLAVLKPLNARQDRRHIRRAITEEELGKLVQAAHEAPEVLKVSGPVRALVYVLAAETGFRGKEIASLRVGSFNLLDPEKAGVELPAHLTKNRQDALIPLRPATAVALSEFFGKRGALQSAFGLREGWRAARLLRGDLKRAEIPYEDESGRVFDFHALRGMQATRLFAHGATPKETQHLIRHASADLTLSLYAKLRPDEDRRALALLPNILPKDPAAIAATGTEGSDCSASCSASEGLQSATEVDGPGLVKCPEAFETPDSDSVNGGGGGNRTRVPEAPCFQRLRA